MKGFLCASLIGAALAAGPALAGSIGERSLPMPDWTPDNIEMKKAALQKPPSPGEHHPDSLLQRQMRHLRKLRELAERDAQRMGKLKRLRKGL